MGDRPHIDDTAHDSAHDAAPAPPTPRRSRTTLRRWEWTSLLFILVVGAGLRAAYLHEYSQGPFIDYVAVKPDPAFHDDAARALLGLYDPANPQGHGPGQPSDAPYLHPPGIIYFLAGVYALTGPVLLHAYLAQMLLGLINCVLTFALARPLFGRGPALITAALMAWNAVLIYYECELHAVVLLIFLLLVLMHATRWWLARDTAIRGVFAGLVLAAVIITQSVVVTFAPVLALWMTWVGWRRGLGRRALIAPTILTVATVVGVAPVTVRNYVASHEFTLVSTWGGLNLYIGNNPEATGLFMMPDGFGPPETMYAYDEAVYRWGEQMGTPWTYVAGNRFLARKALAYITSHPWETAKITVKKALMFWGPLELTHNYTSVHYDRAFSRVLRAIPGGFTVTLALFIIGVALYITRRTPFCPIAAPMQTLVLLFIVVYACSYVPFFVTSQFRTPLLPFLMLFAGYALWQLAGYCVERRLARVLAWSCAGVAVYGVCAIQYVPYDLTFESRLWHYSRFIAYLDKGRHDEAMREYERAAEGLSREFADYVDLAKRFAEHGMRARALEECERAMKANPGWTWVYFELGNRLTAVADERIGVNGRRYPDRWPIDRPALRELGLYSLRHFTELEPQSSAGFLALGRALAAAGDALGAEAAYQRAQALAPAHAASAEGTP